MGCHCVETGIREEEQMRVRWVSASRSGQKPGGRAGGGLESRVAGDAGGGARCRDAAPGRWPWFQGCGARLGPGLHRGGGAGAAPMAALPSAWLPLSKEGAAWARNPHLGDSATTAPCPSPEAPPLWGRAQPGGPAPCGRTAAIGCFEERATKLRGGAAGRHFRGVSEPPSGRLLGSGSSGQPFRLPDLGLRPAAVRRPQCDPRGHVSAGAAPAAGPRAPGPAAPGAARAGALQASAGAARHPGERRREAAWPEPQGGSGQAEGAGGRARAPVVRSRPRDFGSQPDSRFPGVA